MELSYFLAQLLGSSLALFAVAALVRPKLVSECLRSFARDSFANVGFGFIALIAGLAVVLSHNVWEGSWRVVITLFGWASLIKGFTYLAAPKTLLSMSDTLMKNETRIRVVLGAAFAVGAYLAYKGFGY